MIAKGFTEPTERIKRLKKAFVAAVPEVESERAVLVTESIRKLDAALTDRNIHWTLCVKQF